MVWLTRSLARLLVLENERKKEVEDRGERALGAVASLDPDLDLDSSR